jgi:signal peptidase I
MAQWRPAAPTSVRGVGRHDVMFANCDDELRLWVDGRVVAFDAPTTYPDLGNTQPTQADYAPVGVATNGAAARISHLRVMRDIYYTSVRGDGGSQFFPRRHVDFSLESKPSEPERFFVLGDNSPKSKDGRLWGTEYYVSRDLLIGKAVFIYWPHPRDEIRTPWGNVPFPYFPNFGRMGLVR